VRLPAFEFALPPGAKNIKIKTGTQEIAVEPTYYRHSKDGAIPIVALFGGDEFIGEVKEGHWKLEEREDGMGAWRISNGKMEFELASDEAGTTRRLRVDSNSKILLIDGTEIQVELSSPVATLANNATWFSFLLGSERQWNPQNAVLVRIKIDTSGVQFQVYSRIDNGAWTERYASTKGTTNLNVVFKIILDGSTLRVYSKEGSATEFTERWNHANWLPNLVYPIFRSMSNSTDKQTFTCDFVRVTYPNFKVVYDLDDDAYQGESEELLKKAWDTSGNGNHGVVYGATWVRDGKFGKALSFDGSDDNVDCGNIPDLGQEFTVVLWSKRLGSTGNYGTLISIDGPYWSTTGGFLIFDDNSGFIKGRIRNHASNTETSVILETSVPNNVWRFYAVVWDKPTLKGYRNGELVDSETWDYDIGWNVFKTHIGRWTGDYFYGLIDEVRIYNRALSESEIQTLYNGGTVTDGLVGEWKFDGGNNRGEVIVWDTMGSSDEDDWVRVYDPSHKFVGDCVIENGLVRLKVELEADEFSQWGFWNGKEWKMYNINIEEGNRKARDFKVLTMGTEKVIVEFKSLVFGQSDNLTRAEIRRGEPFIRMSLVSGEVGGVYYWMPPCRFIHSEDAKVIDHGVQSGWKAFERGDDNFISRISNTQEFQVFNGREKNYGSGSNVSIYEGIKSVQIGEMIFIGVFDFPKYGNLFKEAEA